MVKKRWMGLVVAFLLAVSPALLSGANAESVLLEKMRRQLDAGSGLKGTVTVSGLTGIEGLHLDVQYILQKAQSQLLLSLKDVKGELAKAVLYGQGDMLALDAGFASGKLYSLQGGLEQLLARLLYGETGGDNTSLLSALQGIITLDDEKAADQLSKEAAPYLTKVELWMQGFAEPPVLEKDEGGVTVLKAAYRIPAAALKAELKQLLVDLLADEALLPLLWSHMTQEQANLYLNPALQSFYFQAVDALPLQGDITMLRRVSTVGQLLETSLTLPLCGPDGGTKLLSFTNKAAAGGDLTDCTLELEEGVLHFTAQKTASPLQDTAAYAGVIRYLPAEMPNWQVDSTVSRYAGKALSVSYQAVYTTKLEAADAQEKSSESYSLSLDLAPDWSHLGEEATAEVKAQYILTEPVQITATMQLASGQARNAATSLNAQMHIVSGGADWVLEGQLKTTPPWTFQPVDVLAADKLQSLTQAQLSALVAEFLGKPALLPLLINLLPSDQDIPGTVG